jgi:hypothetical protein
MRHISLLLATAALVAPLGAQTAPAAPTVDQLIAKHAEALGGQAKLDAMKSFRMVANIPGPGGIDIGLTIERRFPDCQRTQVDVMGKSMITVCNAQGGSNLNELMGQTEPQAMSADELKTVRESIFAGGALLQAKSQGSGIESLGLVDLPGGAKAYKLKITPKNGEDTSFLYLDGSSYLIVRAEGKRKQAGQTFDATMTFKDFKAVSGMTFPFTQIVEAAGAPTQTIEISTVEVNPAIQDSRFTLPAKSAAAPTAAK